MGYQGTSSESGSSSIRRRGVRMAVPVGMSTLDSAGRRPFGRPRTNANQRRVQGVASGAGGGDEPRPAGGKPPPGLPPPPANAARGASTPPQGAPPPAPPPSQATHPPRAP